ncbi:MAG: undecaprenyldiphospho-muramoylpentapeptide beta-N-acetylglucosaminyltransferase [Alphaproteobacteria bacterium]|nr:undecaprenyldiphospho-muramoylpentapeptide beta-N-acetylglucosaminyltransferase [Alphaproteobacteria bacterium]
MIEATANAPLILLTAGGTGGHVFPAEALATALAARGYRLGLVTDKRGQAYGGRLGALDTHRINAGGIAGKNMFARLFSVVELARGAWQAWRLIRKLKPAAVVGFGGYASVPAMMAATVTSVPTAIHEQNALLGRANRLLASRVKRIAASFRETKGLTLTALGRIVFTGMPVRAAIREKAGQPLPPLDGPLGVLVMGGSQGATVLSEVVPAALALLPEGLRARLDVTQQCREEDIDAVRAAYGATGIRAHLASFIDDVPERLARAHVVITRAGASSVAEALCVGRPAILIPYPYAADDHQTHNARAVDAAGAGWLMAQDAFSPATLSARLQGLFEHPETLQQAADRARELARVDAAEALADVVEGLIVTQTGRAEA